MTVAGADTQKQRGQTRHPATADAWAWLESRTPEQLSPQRRDHIIVRLQEIDRIFNEWDRVACPHAHVVEWWVGRNEPGGEGKWTYVCDDCGQAVEQTTVVKVGEPG